jgi:hypothetical protein
VGQTNPGYLAGSLRKNEPQAVYAEDPQDCWNRIFFHLFTRTLKVGLSQDFPEGAPIADILVPSLTFTNRLGAGAKGGSPRLFERIESGDRAVEPLYPHEQFRQDVSTAQLLTEPRFSEFKAALTQALEENSSRPPLKRALMQSDAWAAYDFVARDVSSWILLDAPIHLYHERQALLRKLLAQFIKKLALTPQEIKALPDNYALAAQSEQLPDLFSTNSPWLEVLWLPDRQHDRAAHARRASRVFVKPAKVLPDKLEFVRRATRDDAFYRKLEAVALVVQDLLVDQAGKVVPSPLTCAVQMRIFATDAGGDKQETHFVEYELSRRALLETPATGGLKNLSGNPAYLPGAGNDYSFAAPFAAGGSPIAVSLASRCTACHGPEGRTLFTFAARPSRGAPPVRILKPSDNEHAWWVAGEKMKDKYLKALTEDWK